MARVFLIVILIAALAAVGCNKKQEEIDALQQEATSEDAAAAMDSLDDEVGGATAEETVEPAQSVPTTVQTKTPPAKAEPDYSNAAGFVLQVGSYKDYEIANYWAEKYQSRDYPAFLRQVDLDGETYYRLRIGVYDTFEEAKEVGDQLVDRYSASYWIDNNR